MKFANRAVARLARGCRFWVAAWLAAAGLAGTGLAASPVADGKSVVRPPTRTYDVQIIRDVTYYDGPGADKVRNQLDVYIPKGRQDFPVLFVVHGGAWIRGDKNFFGLHRAVALYWARHGVGTVMINYRLSPAVQHPTHVQDVARAFAWTCKHIRRYGGRPDQIFIWGHSAGGHLVSLLATDESYLKAVGLGLGNIKGVISMSGVYSIPLKNTVFNRIFGADPEQRKEASPLNHVGANEPPFLILCADNDLALCGKKPSAQFCKALQDHKASARMVEIKGRNHNTVFWRACKEDDPAVQAIERFMQTCTSQQKAERSKPTSTPRGGKPATP